MFHKKIRGQTPWVNGPRPKLPRHTSATTPGQRELQRRHCLFLFASVEVDLLPRQLRSVRGSLRYATPRVSNRWDTKIACCAANDLGSTSAWAPLVGRCGRPVFRSPSNEASIAPASRLAIGHVEGINSREDNAPIKRKQFGEGKT